MPPFAAAKNGLLYFIIISAKRIPSFCILHYQYPLYRKSAHEYWLMYSVS